ncbi:HAD hydrolase family protein, partial [Candidatus Woesearchaeota archaeon]|nr:HAD hydrolase family protein [Candidatus Woesearchaeota archaeon]
SYYIDDTAIGYDILKEVEKRIGEVCKDAVVIYSIDETHDIGLIDILPRIATKIDALEYLREKLGFVKKEVIYSGDSGNDILPLTCGYRAIVVRNAIQDIKDKVIEIAKEKEIKDKIYIAKGKKNLNGYYVSGILEGLIHYNIIDDI